MITKRDEDYQQTKRIKKAGVQLETPFRELADWVVTSYGVHVINIFYDTVMAGRDNRPRLSVILETQEDALKFHEGGVWFGKFNKIDQDRVKEQFRIILSALRDSRFKLEGLFVIFVAFEPVARAEANESVTKEEVNQLKAQLANEDLWEISRLFDSVTFFFFTDAQAKKYEALGIKEVYAREYGRLVQGYDEFGYLQKRGVSVSFDSKQNFDTNYNSNWYYYYK